MDIGCGSHYLPLDSGICCIYGIVQGFLNNVGVVVSVNSVAASQGTPELMGERKSLEVAPSVQEIVKKVQILESSGGKYNYSKCEAIGKYNRSGYGIPGNGKYLCFDTKEQEDETIMAWFEEKLKKHPLKKCLCIYNTGMEIENCHYASKFELL